MTQSRNRFIFCFALALFLLGPFFYAHAVSHDNNNSGPPSVEHSTITVNPSTIPPDGESEARITVLLVDKGGGPLPDGTEVRLRTSMGTIVSENPTVTQNGRAVFVIQAPDYPGHGIISLMGYPEIEPAEIRFSD